MISPGQRGSHYLHSFCTWRSDAFSAEGNSTENVVGEMAGEIPARGCAKVLRPCRSGVLWCQAGCCHGHHPHSAQGGNGLADILLKAGKFWWGWTSLGGERRSRRPITRLGAL